MTKPEILTEAAAQLEQFRHWRCRHLGGEMMMLMPRGWPGWEQSIQYAIMRLGACHGMTYVDSALLDVTERWCRRFQAWTGRTNLWLAFQLTNLSIVVYFTWVTTLSLSSGDPVFRIFVVLFGGGVFFVLTRTVFKTSIESLEADAYRRVAKGLRNPRRIRDTQLRIAFLTLSLVLSYPLWLAYVTLHLHFVLLTDALIILTTILLYVIACDPLPPCPGKVREWFRGRAMARNANADLAQ